MLKEHNTPIIAIADDFTGAAEIAGIGLRYGLTAEVQTAYNPNTTASLIVIDSDTRTGTVSHAVETVSGITSRLNGLSPRLVYKKTDSVLRGHVAVEIEAIADILGKGRVLLIPANPGMGRIIQSGVYSVDGVPLHETEFNSDPEYPVSTSEVTELLGSAGKYTVRSIAAPSPIPEGILAIGDATGTENLAQWSLHIQNDCLPAGGGEFFPAILERFGYRAQKKPAKHVDFPIPSLFVSGSMSAYSRETVKRAASGGMPVFTVPVAQKSPEERAVLAEKVADAVSLHGTALLAVDSETADSAGDPRSIPGIVAGFVERVVHSTDIRTLYITGGATAAAVLHRLGWSRFVPVEELSHGVSRMRVMEMNVDCSVIVKPGSYPWPDSLVMIYFS